MQLLPLSVMRVLPTDQSLATLLLNFTCKRQCAMMRASTPQWELPLARGSGQECLQASVMLLFEGVVTKESFVACADLS